jgi:dipeptidase D
MFKASSPPSEAPQSYSASPLLQGAFAVTHVLQSNADLLADLAPRAVWRHFAELAARPRPSGAEAGVRTYIIAWAEDCGLKGYQDDAGNLVVKVPGRGRGEAAETLIMQGHLDMVTEKNRTTEHDFDTDPIRLREEGGWIAATGTTLGADNGIGVSLLLAAGEGHFADHPPLELLFTVDEETGMTGAKQLDVTYLSGRRLLNLDAEEEGVLYVGCAGGVDRVVSLPFVREPAVAGEVTVSLTVEGLRGGHSGLDIAKNRGNAIRLLVRVLMRLPRAGVEYRLANFDGGSKRNAIPREARAELRIRAELARRIPELLPDFLAELKELHGDSEGEWQIGFDVHPDQAPATLPAGAAQRALAFLHTVSDGVVSLSQAIPGLVETSSNLGVVTTEEERLTVTVCARSANPAALALIGDRIAAHAYLAGMISRSEAGYPAWKPDMSSQMLAITKQVFTDFAGGVEPEVTAIHAGLECGLFRERMPHLDMISFGPDIENAHSPDERVRIASVAVVAGQVGDLLTALCSD